jgi:hypothetical protein
MRDYCDRHFSAPAAPRAAVARWFESLQRRIGRQLARAGAAMELHLPAGAPPHLEIRLRGQLDGAFFRRCGRQLAPLLRRRQARVTLIVEELQQRQLRLLSAMLRKLERYGDRIHIVMSAALGARLALDPSVFNLVLEAGQPAGAAETGGPLG